MGKKPDSDDAWKQAHGYSRNSPGWGMSRSELEGFEGRWPDRVGGDPKDYPEPADDAKKRQR